MNQIITYKIKSPPKKKKKEKPNKSSIDNTQQQYWQKPNKSSTNNTQQQYQQKNSIENITYATTVIQSRNQQKEAKPTNINKTIIQKRKREGKIGHK